MTDRVIQVCNVRPDWGRWDNPTNGRVYDINGIAPTLRAMSGGGAEPKILELYED